MAHLQQRTAAWHNARRGKLTASNLGAALGLVSYVSRNTAYRRCMGLDKFEGNVATEWGTNNEANGIADYQTLTGNIVVATGLHTHRLYQWLAGSPDGFVGSEGMIEVKCPFYYRKDGGRLHKEVPMHYLLQMNALMSICERKWCDYVCWEPNGMVVYRVTYDPTLFDFLLTFYGQFYASMQANADEPSSLSVAERDEIKKVIAHSMKQTVNYEFWTRPPTMPPPSSDPFIDEDPEAPDRKKRKRVSGVQGEEEEVGNTATTTDSEMAIEAAV